MSELMKWEEWNRKELRESGFDDLTVYFAKQFFAEALRNATFNVSPMIEPGIFFSQVYDKAVEVFHQKAMNAASLPIHSALRSRKVHDDIEHVLRHLALYCAVEAEYLRSREAFEREVKSLIGESA